MKPSSQLIAPLLAQVMRQDNAFCTLLVVDKYNRLVAAAGSAADRQILLKELNGKPLAPTAASVQAGKVFYRILAVTKSVFLVAASNSDDQRFAEQSAQLQHAIVQRLRNYLRQQAQQRE